MGRLYLRGESSIEFRSLVLFSRAGPYLDRFDMGTYDLTSSSSDYRSLFFGDWPPFKDHVYITRIVGLDDKVGLY